MPKLTMVCAFSNLNVGTPSIPKTDLDADLNEVSSNSSQYRIEPLRASFTNCLTREPVAPLRGRPIHVTLPVETVATVFNASSHETLVPPFIGPLRRSGE